MARVSVATQAVTPAGVAPTFQAGTTDGEIVDVGANLTLVVRNGGGSSTTLTVQTPMQYQGLDVAEVSLVLAAGATGFVALDPTLFRRTAAPDAGRAYVNYTVITSVTVAVIQR
jgi:hypothetical protein